MPAKILSTLEISLFSITKWKTGCESILHIKSFYANDIFHQPIYKWKWYKGSLLFWYGLWIIRKLKAVNETGRLPYNFENYAKQKMFWKVFSIGFVLEFQGHPLNNHFASWVVFNIFIFVLIQCYNIGCMQIQNSFYHRLYYI